MKFKDYPTGTRLSKLPKTLRDLHRKAREFAKNSVIQVIESKGEDVDEVYFDQEYIDLFFAKYSEFVEEPYPHHLNWN